MVGYIKGDNRDAREITEILRCNRCSGHRSRVMVMNATYNATTTHQLMVQTYEEVLVPWWPISRPIMPSPSVEPRGNGKKTSTTIIGKLQRGGTTNHYQSHHMLPLHSTMIIDEGLTDWCGGKSCTTTLQHYTKLIQIFVSGVRNNQLEIITIYTIIEKYIDNTSL